MNKFIRKHNLYLEKIKIENITSEIIKYHDRQIKWLQHERLVHLLVMLFVMLIYTVVTIFLVFFPSIGVLLLWFGLTPLLIAYIMHYFKLENTVQKWYRISNDFYMGLLSKNEKK
jgi:hypothetical protein